MHIERKSCSPLLLPLLIFSLLISACGSESQPKVEDPIVIVAAKLVESEVKIDDSTDQESSDDFFIDEGMDPSGIDVCEMLTLENLP
jgi:hypothetical protein